jgi:hypothetical protein
MRKSLIAIVYHMWNATWFAFACRVLPGSYTREKEGIMSQKFEELHRPDPATLPPDDREYDGIVITPISAPLLTGTSASQGEAKQYERSLFLSRREAIVGLIGLVGGIVVGAGGALAALQFSRVSNPGNSNLPTEASNPGNPDLPTEASDLDFSAGTADWFLAGDSPQDYTFGIDPTVMLNGKPSAYLKTKVAQPSGFGTLMQAFQGIEYRGKRVRMTGYAKAQAVENWAGLWMRVDGANQDSLSFDNMQNRPIRGTLGWKQYAIVLDVPQESNGIFFGILLAGPGQVWLMNVQFEIVSSTVPTTSG